MMEIVDDTEEEKTLEWLQWAEYSLSDDDDIALIALEEGFDIAQSFLPNDFPHDWIIDAKITGYMYKANTNPHYCTPFDGLSLGAWVNRKDVININQYRASSKTFNLPQSIRPPSNRAITGNSGIRISIRVVKIEIPFKKLRVVIEATFLVLEDSTLTLLFMKDMLDNSLGICIQERHMRNGTKWQPLKIENYFLIHARIPGEHASDL